MDKISQQQLRQIIILHGKFLKGTTGGVRAIIKFKDLSGLDFRLADLTNADFSGSRFNGANLSQATCTSASFFACDLHKADLKAANFTRADFRGAEIIGADLTEAIFKHADFRQGYMLNYDSENPDEGWGQQGDTEFSGSTIRDTDLSNVMAQHTNFSDANLTGVTMHNADLQGADLSGANLTGTDFSGSSMARTKLEKAIVDDTNLNGVSGDISTLEDLMEEQKNRKKLDKKSQTKNLDILVRNHSLWVESAGKNGAQLNLTGYDLSKEKDLRKYPLSIIIAEDCVFTGLDLENASMQSSTLDKSDFQDCAAHGADFRASSFKSAIFTRADLSQADFSALKVEKKGETVSFQPSDLTKAKLAYANLEGTNFKDANLTGADFTHANLRGADFTDATIDGATFKGADLSETILEGKAE